MSFSKEFQHFNCFNNSYGKKWSKQNQLWWDPRPFDSLRLATVPSNLWHSELWLLAAFQVIRWSGKWWSFIVISSISMAHRTPLPSEHPKRNPCWSRFTPNLLKKSFNPKAPDRYGGHLRPYLSVTGDPTPLKHIKGSLATLPLFTARATQN